MDLLGHRHHGNGPQPFTDKRVLLVWSHLRRRIYILARNAQVSAQQWRTSNGSIRTAVKVANQDTWVGILKAYEDTVFITEHLHLLSLLLVLPRMVQCIIHDNRGNLFRPSTSSPHHREDSHIQVQGSADLCASYCLVMSVIGSCGSLRRDLMAL